MGTPTPTKKKITDLSNSQKLASPAAQFDLQGPVVCQLSSSEASLSAFLKDKKILVKIEIKDKINNFLYKDDCLFVWTSGVFSGEKKCGLSPYFKTIEDLLSMNLFSFDNFITSLIYLEKTPFLPINISDVKKLINSCKKEEIENLSIFEAPERVLFKNK